MSTTFITCRLNFVRLWVNTEIRWDNYRLETLKNTEGKEVLQQDARSFDVPSSQAGPLFCYVCSGSAEGDCMLEMGPGSHQGHYTTHLSRECHAVL